MADPLTLGLLGSLAATEGIKFIYYQASEVLKSWREHRDAMQPVSVPFVSSEVLDGSPAAPLVNMAVVRSENATLARLIGALHPYATSLQDIDEHDETLAQDAGDLRALLESAYAQRLTFTGELREHTGASVNVRQTLGSVSGHVVGIEGDSRSGKARVTQKIDAVEQSGSVIGYKGQIGG